jgi:O-antigen/teichoic acid export membrane protein
MLLLPVFSGAGSVATLRSQLRAALPLYVLPAVIYCAIVTGYHQPIFRWLYLGRYAGASWLLPFTAPMVVAAGVAAVYVNALRGLQRPERVFWSNTLASGAALTVGVLLTMRYQLVGAVIGLTLSHVIIAAASGIYLVKAMAVKDSA